MSMYGGLYLSPPQVPLLLKSNPTAHVQKKQAPALARILRRDKAASICLHAQVPWSLRSVPVFPNSRPSHRLFSLHKKAAPPNAQPPYLPALTPTHPSGLNLHATSSGKALLTRQFNLVHPALPSRSILRFPFKTPITIYTSMFTCMFIHFMNISLLTIKFIGAGLASVLSLTPCPAQWPVYERAFRGCVQKTMNEPMDVAAFDPWKPAWLANNSKPKQKLRKCNLKKYIES